MAFRFKGWARRLLCPQPNSKRSRVHAENAESLQVRLFPLQCVFCGFSLEPRGTMRYAAKAIYAPKLSSRPKMDARSRRNAAVRKSTFLQVGCTSLSG